MKKFVKALAAIMLMVAVVCAAGCKKPEDPNNGGNEGGGGNGGGNGGGGGGGPTLTTEGIYLGIIGFNQYQYEKEISLLNEQTKETFTRFIDGFHMENLTGLYYADYLALQRMQSCGVPPKLANVALVTFTDGLDNTSVSPATPELNPEHYPSKEAYLEALNQKIKNDKVHGDTINAYTIGLKGTDAISNMEEFRHNLHMLASSESNEYVAENMEDVAMRFAEIAESLYSETATASLKLLLPGGYEDGLDMRFTFDGSSVPENSSLYLECKYRNVGTAIRLENITYHGFKGGVSTMESNEVENGFMKFVFVDLTKDNGDLISESDKELLQVYKKTTTSWGLDSEFDKDQQSHVIPEQKSAIIMLVLDCTTSLGTDSFNKMKEAAKDFVETLVNSSLGLNKPQVTTNSVSGITATSATCGGNVTSDCDATVTARGVCWSSNHNPTISNHCTNDGSGTGSFTSSITGLASGKTYYVRAYATNSVGTSYGEQKTFSTLEVNKPTVTTNNVSNVTQTTATCGGKVTSDGGDAVTARGVCWSTSQNPTIEDQHTNNGTGTGSFTSNITGLTANKTYYVRAYATNGAGTSYGEQKTLTTESVALPTVTTNNVTNITQTTATCGGNVTNDGGGTITRRGIVWSTHTNPTLTDFGANSGTGTGSFTANLTGLTSGTTYYVRAFAVNSAGTSYGPQKSFTTTTTNLIEEWLYYGDWNNHMNCWGLTNGGSDEWAVMFPASMLSPYNGTSITSIDVYIGEDIDCKLKIYKGGTSQPTTLLKSQNFSASVGWNSIEISPLLLQTSTSLWVSISCSHSAGEYPNGACEGINNPNARWWNPNGNGWRDMYDSNGGTDLCWEIQVYVTNQAKGEKGDEIQLPQTPSNPQHAKEIKVSRNPHEVQKKYK